VTTYSIKDLEQLSGIKAHTLRIWEQRYDLLSPKRTDSNIRYYDDEDLKLILNISLLYDNGFKISKIASMPDELIREEVMNLTDRSLTHDDQVHALTICMIEMDEDRFDKILTTNIIKIGFEQTMLNIIYPFLSKIGLLWQTGAVNPAQEHFISNLVRQKLVVAIDGQISSGSGKKFLLFLPEGELHEISLLFATYLIKSKGHKVFYLGQSTPFKDVEAVYDLVEPEYLLTVMTSQPIGKTAQEYIDLLSKKFSSAEIFVSGYQVVGQDLSLGPNVRQFTYIREVKDLLDEIDQVFVEK